MKYVVTALAIILTACTTATTNIPEPNPSSSNTSSSVDPSESAETDSVQDDRKIKDDTKNAKSSVIPSVVEGDTTNDGARFDYAQRDTDTQELEQLPSELTIDYFSTMRLEGKDLQLEKVLADNSAYTRYRISYLSNGLTISGIMNIPKGKPPYPLVVLNHGYIDPSIYTVGRGLKREQDYLARQGFAVLHTDYRGHGLSDASPDTKEMYDASLEYAMDSLNAINAVRASDLPELIDVDASKPAMLGHSLGGGLTLNVAAARPDMINAAVLYAPVSGDAYKNFDRWRRERPEGDNTIATFGEQGSEAWQKLSAINYLENIDDPILLFHGTSDDDVPIEWSYELETAMEEAGKDFTLVVFDPEEHEFIPRFTDFMVQTKEFLWNSYLEDVNTDQDLWGEIIEPERITKKPFGMFITPETSPVSPEKFTGYHTGVDFEVEENEDETQLNVLTICSGELIYKNWVNGYGGVVIQACAYNDQPVTVLYGHINLHSVELSVGTTVEKGMFLATLGKGYSEQTDGERPHLHLAVHKGAEQELRGYVQTEEELSNWIDPMELL